jgi:(p)ppGpp synthase/HD superfamily hydrolase
MEFLRPVDSVLSPVEIEAAEKLRSALQPPEPTENTFVQACRETVSGDDLAAIEQALVFASSLRSTDPNHPSMRAYFSHPLRVATFVIRLMTKPTVAAIITALLHNVFEVSGLDEDDLSAFGFGKRAGSGIRLLTIDRTRQYDSEYLERFYRNIENFGDELVLLKCIDRLDNLLAFDLINKTAAHERYIDLSEQFIVPLASKLSRDFGVYFQRAIDYARASTGNSALQQQYQEFLRRVNEDESEEPTLKVATD